jgi:hypothetical protein
MLQYKLAIWPAGNNKQARENPVMVSEVKKLIMLAVKKIVFSKNGHRFIYTI